MATKPSIRKAAPPSDNLFFSSPKNHLKLITSGCAVLDCALGGGWPLGKIANIVGDSQAGKSLIAIEAVANFQRLFPTGLVAYCETEAAMDDAYATALGIDLSGVKRPKCATVEELFDNMQAFIKEIGTERAGLYIVDSLDALSDKAEQDRGIAESTYGATKPKQLGQLFRRLVKPLEASHVCVIIVSQTRDAIGITFGDKKTRSGGRALEFYASQIIWLAHIGQIKKTIQKIQRTIGITVKGKVKKNRIGLPFREAQVDILFGYGIDDIGSALTYLDSACALARIPGLTTADAFKKKFWAANPTEQAAIRKQVAAVVQEVWFEVERTFLPLRGKYHAA